ncbi:hypothetical protein [Paraclostridium sordellii]|uniref:hypothetical protein n=1 Tax=Paraclostridium sordellii TaxID=1505 RepID=UPI0002D9248E|nr:hypothetical protein [Paeniclostridium sordellii]CEK34498.1 hypothetical protein UMC2_37091 [[Clostridium] sordellii] [Paeniclostridium sordellii]
MTLGACYVCPRCGKEHSYDYTLTPILNLVSCSCGYVTMLQVQEDKVIWVKPEGK